MTHTELKQDRLTLGLTQKEMASRLNTPYTTYQKWELGSRRVPGIVEVAIKQIQGEQHGQD